MLLGLNTEAWGNSRGTPQDMGSFDAQTNDCITYRKLTKRAGMDKVELLHFLPMGKIYSVVQEKYLELIALLECGTLITLQF